MNIMGVDLRERKRVHVDAMGPASEGLAMVAKVVYEERGTGEGNVHDTLVEVRIPPDDTGLILVIHDKVRP